MSTIKPALELNLQAIIEVSTGFAIVQGLTMNFSNPLAPLVSVTTKGILSGEINTVTCAADTTFETF